MANETKDREVAVGVVILHYNNEADTISCIESVHISGSHYPRVPIIIVLNAISFSFINTLKKRFPHVTILENEENLGFAGGNNKGIEYALNQGCDAVIFLNNDTIASINLILQLTSYILQNTSAGIISPKIYFAAGFEYHKNRYTKDQQGKVIWYAGGTIDWATVYAQHIGVDLVDHGQHDTIMQTDFATGCCMMVKREVFETIGLFDTKYFLYYEDVDFCVRAKKAGFQIQYYPKAHLWHKNASSSDKPGSPIHVYYQTRNRLYFGYKYAPIHTKKSLFIESMKMLVKGGVQAKAVKDYYLGRMGRMNERPTKTYDT